MKMSDVYILSGAQFGTLIAVGVGEFVSGEFSGHGFTVDYIDIANESNSFKPISYLIFWGLQFF